ncbi:hypothetical protein [Halocalculus aciditolerans]|uniref:Uncharacterized protein n=1 Tax=Halocalculus aciditolerans TaxID=1383812 RepID=A0A830F964_9EURY|nr:hypothetical protein [Halocalculus aciditolerans]GGL51982.1 hypothetical protein GCM10009039_07810 [Halocalculus aciditolerans]
MPQKRLVFQIVGAIGSVIVAITTLYMLYLGYQMWQSPPVIFTREHPISVVKVSLMITEGLVLIIGAYLTRQLFYWAGLPETFQSMK